MSAPVAGSVERVVRDFPVTYGPDFVQGRKKLPPVTRLNCMVPGYTVGDIFHEPAGHLFSGHFRKTDSTACDPEPVCSIRAIGESTCGTDDGERTVSPDPVHHPDNPMLFRYNPDICLACRSPFAAVACRDARLQKRSLCGFNSGADRENFCPDYFGIKGCAEVIGDLFADSIPVGFSVRLIALVIEPHRARVATHKVRNRDGFTMIRQDDPSLQRGEMIRLYLLFQNYPLTRIPGTWFEDQTGLC
jgi:hypothetical protein